MLICLAKKKINVNIKKVPEGTDFQLIKLVLYVYILRKDYNAVQLGAHLIKITKV